ncbi:1-deoxy-D-xylulose-5-phosphate synthase [Lapillicoccus jejuensis]|uniref:1-deoxy-D-xylulose-5-phosphate synthase n=1 Tax=Lapillicoccus jejuensis TaxID=402171 RepID=A0A542E5K9_9MICO|nr:1-deoxy-D-xylulose-5-phosphate synthase [Lapillicoccus jejuensis]TQJ10576.1 1-deoxy-D-xylulose-5-phosphate synthase [Lapillicoccus jejuensis]
MALLDRIDGPDDVRSLPPEALPRLAGEIREFLIESVSRTGGHLGPNLGVVELTIALHRVFASPRDTIVFDTGHQSYVHKLLTGRRDFGRLRQRGGLSGYPSRGESEHDVVENSHASTSLSWADGIAKARRLAGERDRHTVAVIGDGALTGGMAWEALNNIAAEKDLPLVIVVNDNERSYAPTTGGLADYLATLRTTQGYEAFLTWGKNALSRTPVIGNAVYGAAHGMKKGLKDMVAPQGMFEDLGLKYLGPIDGHDTAAVEATLRRARDFGRPVLVHVLTKKGKGYDLARRDEADQFHAVDKINPETGLPLQVKGRIWTDEFSDALMRVAADRDDLVAITAAMLIPVGLREFAERHPDRVFDVGIAEQHAVTMAAGLAYGGLHPVVCVYATFLNRAFDQLLMDCALHRAGVTFVLDRAGVTGTDGASHNGMWDMTLTGMVPGLHLCAPRDAEALGRALAEAVDVPDAPTVIRFSKQNPPAPLPAVRRSGSVDVLAEPGEGDVDLLLVGLGELATTAVSVAEKLTAQGRSVRVVDPHWCLPVSADLVDLARSAGAVAVLEDNLVVGGVGSQVALALHEARVEVPVHLHGIPKRFLDHGSRGEVLEEIGLTPDAVADALDARLR